MTTRSFLVNLLVEIVDEARLRIPIVRDIKLPGFSSLVMECFLPSILPSFPSLSFSSLYIPSCIAVSLCLSSAIEVASLRRGNLRNPHTSDTIVREIFKLAYLACTVGSRKGRYLSVVCPWGEKGRKITVEEHTVLISLPPSVLFRAF